LRAFDLISGFTMSVRSLIIKSAGWRVRLCRLRTETDLRRRVRRRLADW